MPSDDQQTSSCDTAGPPRWSIGRPPAADICGAAAESADSRVALRSYVLMGGHSLEC